MSKDLTIFHNPRCTKSRQTLQIIEEAGRNVTVAKYLEDSLSADEIKEILSKLNMAAEDIVRKGEKTYKEHFKGKTMSEDEWIQAMVEYPILIERPIVVKGNKAVIGRPPENVRLLL